MTPAPAPDDGSARTRALFVVHDPGVSGAQRVLLTLLRGVDRSRFECHVVVPYDGPFVTEVRDLGHHVHVRLLMRWVPSRKRVEKTGFIRYLAKFTAGLRARAQSIAELVERLRVAVVVTNTVTCLEGAVAARMAGVPHVWYIHESIEGNRDLRRILPAFAYRAFIGALSTEVVFVSRSLAASYGRLRTYSRVVYPGLALPPGVDRSSARSRLLQRTGFPATARLVGVVGALQPGKDHPTFLTAAQAIREHFPDAHFVIVGRGAADYTQALEQRTNRLGLRSSTKFLGQVPSEEMYDLMAGLHVLVISSIQESFGLTAVEALAVETPVVATQCGGPSEILADDIGGTLVPVGDAVAMARAVEDLLSSPDTARAQGRAGRERVEHLFGMKRFVNDMQHVLEGATAAGRHASLTSPTP